MPLWKIKSIIRPFQTALAPWTYEPPQPQRRRDSLRREALLRGSTRSQPGGMRTFEISSPKPVQVAPPSPPIIQEPEPPPVEQNPYARSNGHVPNGYGTSSSSSANQPVGAANGLDVPVVLRRKMSTIAESSINTFKFAFHNISLTVFAIACLVAAVSAYLLFVDFVKPLIWACICGIVLYPLKRTMTAVVKNWLDRLSDTQTPLLLGLVLMPIEIIDSVGDSMFSLIGEHSVFVGILASSIPVASLILQRGFIPNALMATTGTLKTLDAIVFRFSGNWVLALFVIYQNYLIAAGFIPNLRSGFICNFGCSFAIWTFLLAYICNYFGPFRALSFFACFVIAAVYGFYNRSGLWTSSEAERDPVRKRASLLSDGSPRLRSRDSFSQRRARRSRHTSVSPHSRNASISDPRRSVIDAGGDLPSGAAEELESNLYIKWLLMACFFVYLSLHLWLLGFILIPLFIGGLKRLAFAFNLPNLVRSLWASIKGGLNEVQTLIIPFWIRDFCAVVAKADLYLIIYLKSSMDVVGSIVAMMLLVLTIFTVLLFILSQLYYESVHMINLATDIANQTFSKNAHLRHWLEHSWGVTSISETTDKVVEQFYGYGRTWLSGKVRLMVDNSEKADVIQEQILTSLDTMLSSWMPRNGIHNASDETVSSAMTSKFQSGNAEKNSILSGWSQVWDIIWSAYDDDDWDFGVFDKLQQNLLVLSTFVHSAWSVLASNTEQILGVFGQILGTVFYSGTAVVNFLLDTTVFLTILFQLLCSSNDQFKPLELLQYCTTNKDVANRISSEIEDAVSSVFTVSLKMAVFYGFYTWLTHTLFAVNLIFIPSVLAAILAAVPFFGPYLVCIPGVLELWLIRGEPMLAVLMLGIHVLPGYLVDDAIYSEIRTTHPLLTGMAIAGGLLWYGLEGVIFGPVILCCVLVMVSVYNSIMEDVQAWNA